MLNRLTAHPEVTLQFSGSSPIDRGRTRKPRLVGGVKGRNVMKLFLAGKSRPVGGELHIKEFPI